MPVEEQVVSIFAGVNGYLEDIEAVTVTRYEREMLSAVRDKGGDMLADIRESGALSDETAGKLKAFLDDFTGSFVA